MISQASCNMFQTYHGAWTEVCP